MKCFYFLVHIPDFNSIDSGDEEEFYSDEDVDDESLIRIPRAATANGNFWIILIENFNFYRKSTTNSTFGEPTGKKDNNRRTTSVVRT